MELGKFHTVHDEENNFFGQKKIFSSHLEPFVLYGIQFLSLLFGFLTMLIPFKHVLP